MRTTLRHLLLATVLAYGMPPARADQPAKVPRIGYLGGGYPGSSVFESFRQGLRELGYVDGQNIVVERRPYYGDLQLNNSAAELVRLNVAAIVTQSPDSARAAMRATKKIPIVFFISGDPAVSDLVATLDRPWRKRSRGKRPHDRVGRKMA